MPRIRRICIESTNFRLHTKNTDAQFIQSSPAEHRITIECIFEFKGLVNMQTQEKELKTKSNVSTTPSSGTTELRTRFITPTDTFNSARTTVLHSTGKNSNSVKMSSPSVVYRSHKLESVLLTKSSPPSESSLNPQTFTVHDPGSGLLIKSPGPIQCKK